MTGEKKGRTAQRAPLTWHIRLIGGISLTFRSSIQVRHCSSTVALEGGHSTARTSDLKYASCSWLYLEVSSRAAGSDTLFTNPT